MTNGKFTLKNLQEYPIRTSVGTLLVIAGALWLVYRPFLIEDLSADFVTKAELVKNTEIITSQLATMQSDVTRTKATLDKLDTRINVQSAFQMERGFQDDLDKHSAEKPSPVTSRWAEAQRDLTAKRDLASNYKNCILNEEKNCDLMQKQLWQ